MKKRHLLMRIEELSKRIHALERQLRGPIPTASPAPIRAHLVTEYDFVTRKTRTYVPPGPP